MITPDEIVTKLKRLYPIAVRALLAGQEDFFPYRMRADLSPSPVIPDAIREVQELRAHAKGTLGYGYSIQWEPRRSRTHGDNAFPKEIWIETMDDLVRSIGKARAWERLRRAIDTLRTRRPELMQWSIERWTQLQGIEDRVETLLHVVDYLLEHPRPNCFVRELPISMSTKWVSEHQSILSEWLDIVLPPESIDFGHPPRKFEPRYGFRSPSEHIRLRFLDPMLQHRLGFPFDEFSLPLSSLQALPCRGIRLIFAENKINWLTLPPVTNTIAFGGLGRGVAQLFDVAWIQECEIVYWGDIDVEGFEILAMVRHRWPKTRSLLMSPKQLADLRIVATRGQGREPEISERLTTEERDAMAECIRSNIRIEQEHVPQAMLLQELRAIEWLSEKQA